jgi:hypothetical protein
MPCGKYGKLYIYKQIIIHIAARMRRLYKTGYWIDNWIYWITNSYTQLQCIHFITHNN